MKRLLTTLSNTNYILVPNNLVFTQCGLKLQALILQLMNVSLTQVFNLSRGLNLGSQTPFTWHQMDRPSNCIRYIGYHPRFILHPHVLIRVSPSAFCHSSCVSTSYLYPHDDPTFDCITCTISFICDLKILRKLSVLFCGNTTVIYDCTISVTAMKFLVILRSSIKCHFWKFHSKHA